MEILISRDYVNCIPERFVILMNPNTTKVIDKRNASRYIWGDDCKSWILAETDALSVKQESMPSGTKEKLHFHSDAQQFFFVLKGTATFYVDGQKETVHENQGLLICKKSKHYIANETTGTLEFLVISQPGTNSDRINL